MDGSRMSLIDLNSGNIVRSKEIDDPWFSGDESSPTCLDNNSNILYQLLSKGGGFYSITSFSLSGNQKRMWNNKLVLSNPNSKFTHLFYIKHVFYLLEVDSHNLTVGLLSLTDSGSKHLGHLRYRASITPSCILKQSTGTIECMVVEDRKVTLLELDVGANSFTITKENTLSLQLPDEHKISLISNVRNITMFVVLKESSVDIYSLTQKEELIGVVLDFTTSTISNDILIDSTRNQILSLPKNYESVQILKPIHLPKKIQGKLTPIRRFSPQILTVESIGIDTVKLRGVDMLVGDWSMVMYSQCHQERTLKLEQCSQTLLNETTAWGEEACFQKQPHSSCETSVKLSFNSNSLIRKRSKFLDQFNSMNDVYSTLSLETDLPLAVASPDLSIHYSSDGNSLKSVSLFNITSQNERRAFKTKDSNIIGDIMAFVDVTLNSISMGNTAELWIASTDTKYYLQAQIAQFAGQIRLQIYPNLPGDLMTATRKIELESDRKICSQIEHNTKYKLIIQLTNPEFSTKTGLPIWKYRAAIVEATKDELEVCSLEVDSTMKMTEYQTIQDSAFSVAFSQSTYKNLFSTYAKYNASTLIHAIGMRCQSTGCNDVYLVVDSEYYVILGSTLGGSVLLILVVLCCMITICLCITRPWVVVLTEEQKKQMELQRNFDRVQQLQRTMSLGHAHSPVRTGAGILPPTRH